MLDEIKKWLLVKPDLGLLTELGCTEGCALTIKQDGTFAESVSDGVPPDPYNNNHHGICPLLDYCSFRSFTGTYSLDEKREEIFFFPSDYESVYTVPTIAHEVGKFFYHDYDMPCCDHAYIESDALIRVMSFVTDGILLSQWILIYTRKDA